jgi:hypothetical protein
MEDVAKAAAQKRFVLGKMSSKTDKTAQDSSKKRSVLLSPHDFPLFTATKRAKKLQSVSHLSPMSLTSHLSLWSLCNFSTMCVTPVTLGFSSL